MKFRHLLVAAYRDPAKWPDGLLDEVTARIAAERPCLRTFRRELLLPNGNRFMRSLGWFIAVMAGWTALLVFWPDLENASRTIITAAAIITAYNVGRNGGWLNGAQAAYAWMHDDRPEVETDDPLKLDPEAWQTREEA